jgi:hypothetical protein
MRAGVTLKTLPLSIIFVIPKNPPSEIEVINFEK